VPSPVAAPPAASRTITSLPRSAVAGSPRHAVAAPSLGRRSPRLHLLTCTTHRSPLHAIAALDI